MLRATVPSITLVPTTVVEEVVETTLVSSICGCVTAVVVVVVVDVADEVSLPHPESPNVPTIAIEAITEIDVFLNMYCPLFKF
jgi:hypothetical protein